jgi:hypothetical protein
LQISCKQPFSIWAMGHLLRSCGRSVLSAIMQRGHISPLVGTYLLDGNDPVHAAFVFDCTSLWTSWLIPGIFFGSNRRRSFNDLLFNESNEWDDAIFWICCS